MVLQCIPDSGVGLGGKYTLCNKRMLAEKGIKKVEYNAPSGSVTIMVIDNAPNKSSIVFTLSETKSYCALYIGK